MADERPVRDEDPMFVLIRDEKIDEFNKKKAAGEAVDFTGRSFRGLDLRGMDGGGIDFSGSYFRNADLRGVNFSSCNMEGTSIRDAKVSGALFPKDVSADEINLSLTYGTRMRTSKGCCCD